ncbi:hypothetical protein K5I29_01960 [Flavobacterium agricola]|uniref:Lipocalin-like domain-containing protein n=1 Tax=Flavobacterium agricola TaxID=2870839 RepID=A0ABY6LZH0_9FLAO|nr:hypothetical protein [Flavobacterium agricola]UYW01714.1 hypothetical protein K5I29_01960 [Flavobacterium agricola]
MKKLLLIFSTALLLFACSSDDNSGTQVANLTPPDWILGDWRYLVNEGNGSQLTQNGLNFLFNDVCEVYSTNVVCFKSTYGNEPGFSFTEYHKNDSEYKFSYTVGDQTKTYSFVRLDGNKIRQSEGVDYDNAILEKI